MSEMIDRIANRIDDALGKAFDEGYGLEGRDIAVIALAKLREPTAAMIDAAARLTGGNRVLADLLWYAMIDEVAQ